MSDRMLESAAEVCAAPIRVARLGRFGPRGISAFMNFAHEVSGYNLADLEGVDLGALVERHRRFYAMHGRFEGEVLDLRLLLFMEARSWHHGGYEDETDWRRVKAMVAALADAAKRSGQLTAG